MTNEDLTRLYNEANGIPEGKAPPITTERIFTAMRACLTISAKQLADARESAAYAWKTARAIDAARMADRQKWGQQP